jgi:hypothetical protein
MLLPGIDLKQTRTTAVKKFRTHGKTAWVDKKQAAHLRDKGFLTFKHKNPVPRRSFLLSVSFCPD